MTVELDLDVERMVTIHRARRTLGIWYYEGHGSIAKRRKYQPAPRKRIPMPWMPVETEVELLVAFAHAGLDLIEARRADPLDSIRNTAAYKRLAIDRTAA